MMERAHELGFACRVHAEDAEPADAIQLAVEQRALSIDHLEDAGDREQVLLKNSATMVVLLPSNSFLKHGASGPARKLVDAGAPVALGSDYNPQFSPVLSMQSVIAMGCKALGLTPAEAVSASTFNAAHALGIASRVGSLETGKYADVVMLNTRDYRDLGEHLGTNLVHATIKRGEIIYREADVVRREPKLSVIQPVVQ